MFIVLQRKSLKQNEDLLFKKRYKGNQGKLIFINFLVFQFIKKKGKGPKGTSTKDPGTKPKWGRMEGGVGGAGESGGGKMETIVFEQQQKMIKEKKAQS